MFILFEGSIVIHLIPTLISVFLSFIVDVYFMTKICFANEAASQNPSHGVTKY